MKPILRSWQLAPPLLLLAVLAFVGIVVLLGRSTGPSTEVPTTVTVLVAIVIFFQVLTRGKTLDPINVAIALTVYTVALLVRVVADGLTSVSEETMASASAMGYTTRQRLFAVQLPVAVPVIGAGVRVAAVSNVSLVSVASLIGVPQLGSLFIEGNQTNTLTPILIGLIFIIALALIFDGVVLALIRVLAPWQRAAVAAR